MFYVRWWDVRVSMWVKQWWGGVSLRLAVRAGARTALGSIGFNSVVHYLFGHPSREEMEGD